MLVIDSVRGSGVEARVEGFRRLRFGAGGTGPACSAGGAPLIESCAWTLGMLPALAGEGGVSGGGGGTVALGGGGGVFGGPEGAGGGILYVSTCSGLCKSRMILLGLYPATEDGPSASCEP